jgi:hypothetical protein
LEFFPGLPIFAAARLAIVHETEIDDALMLGFGWNDSTDVFGAELRHGHISEPL